jgi:hypothetical protein
LKSASLSGSTSMAAVKIHLPVMGMACASFFGLTAGQL